MQNLVFQRPIYILRMKDCNIFILHHCKIISCQDYPFLVQCKRFISVHMVIFLNGDNVTWTSITPIYHVQWQISNQGLHGRNLFFRYFSGIGT